MSGAGPEKTAEIAARVEAFVRDVVAPYERDPRRDHHNCPTEELIAEIKDKARAAGVLTPHILADGSHLSQRETATVLQRTGLSPLGPLACNTAAPDEGNMYLLGQVGSPEIKARFLQPLVAGQARSAFFMTEPAADGGAGSDPSMMKTVCRQDGNHWVINGRKAFITGANGAQVGIVMAKADEGACMFLVDLPDPAIRIERVPNTLDKPIGAFQLMQAKIADMYVALNSARAYVYAVARACDAGRTTRYDAAGAILLASENAMKVSLEAVQALGGAGYTRDWPVERYMRDAKLLDIGAGTNEIRRMLIGRELIAQ